jgi:hypothetical protein
MMGGGECGHVVLSNSLTILPYHPARTEVQSISYHRRVRSNANAIPLVLG